MTGSGKEMMAGRWKSMLERLDINSSMRIQRRGRRGFFKFTHFMGDCQ
jgi:hypothetical protein